MGTRKRKPFSDITDIYNLTPLSVLRELVASNGICKPPVSILKSNSKSTNHKFFPESSDISNTSIGSSSVGATFNSKTVRFRQPLPAVSATTSRGDIGTKDAEYNQIQKTENSKKERDACVIVSHTAIEKSKDKGKATAGPLSSSASEKAKDSQNKICYMARTDGCTRIQNAAYNQRPTIEKSKKDRKSDVISDHTSVMEMKSKGKAIAVPYNSLPTGKLNEIQSDACNSSTVVERLCPKGLGNLCFSGGSAENVRGSNKNKYVLNSHSSGKLEKGKAILSSPDCALGRKSEVGKDIADNPHFSLEKVNCKKEGILKHSRYSNVQNEDIGEEYLNLSTSLAGGVQDRPKSVTITNSVPDKTKVKGKVSFDPFNTRGTSVTVTSTSQTLRKTSEKNKNDVGVSSCPPMMRTKKIKNDLDEAGDVKYLNSWTDLQAKVRKKRCQRTERRSELPDEFVRKQKAYYDDIDNFELPVEEVSQDELD